MSLGPITSASLRETHGAPPRRSQCSSLKEKRTPTFFASVMGESLFTGQLVVAIRVLGIFFCRLYPCHLIFFFAQIVHIQNPSQRKSHLSFEQFNFVFVAWPHCVRLFACSPWVSSSSSSSPLLSPTPASSWSDFLPYPQNIVNSYLIPPGWFVH